MRHAHEGDLVELEGIITDFTSTTSFSVEGQAVGREHCQIPDGTTGLMKGAHVEVEGTMVNVSWLRRRSGRVGSRNRGSGFECRRHDQHGDTVNSTFVVHGVTVSFAGDVKSSVNRPEPASRREGRSARVAGIR